MKRMPDDTHDPTLASWIASANDPATDFPIQNLPFGRFRLADGETRIGVAIGDRIVDLQRAGLARDADMNALMASGRGADLRRTLSQALREGSAQREAFARHLVARDEATMEMPCNVGDYTDFYASVHHATTVGKQFRPDNPLLPNYKWVPIGYHGRASSIRASPQSFRRPNGQRKPPDADAPIVGPSRRLDYELELGVVIGRGNALGEPIGIVDAEAHAFGMVLLNDWSARDIQGWEYQPLGPFLAKNFASTISPWIVTLEALAPFRCAFSHPEGDPRPLPYLDSRENRDAGAIEIGLEVWLQTEAMRARGHAGDRLSASNFRDAYWTIAQLVTHHTVNGCNLQPGDVLGSGTMSGPSPAQAGSMLELSAAGKKPIALSNGETRSFLEDGDTVILRACCERVGYRRIGFGECRGTVTPAPALAASNS
jgi:fumarylacetoacetase